VKTVGKDVATKSESLLLASYDTMEIISHLNLLEIPTKESKIRA
jgi:hypothetical protein